MSLLKTLKGQILVVSAACMVAALMVLTPVNYFSARAQARVALAEEGQATTKSHAEAIEEWTRAKAGIIAASIVANLRRPGSAHRELGDDGRVAPARHAGGGRQDQDGARDRGADRRAGHLGSPLGRRPCRRPRDEGVGRT